MMQDIFLDEDGRENKRDTRLENGRRMRRDRHHFIEHFEYNKRVSRVKEDANKKGIS